MYALRKSHNEEIRVQDCTVEKNNEKNVREGLPYMYTFISSSCDGFFSGVFYAYE